MKYLNKIKALLVLAIFVHSIMHGQKKEVKLNFPTIKMEYSDSLKYYNESYVVTYTDDKDLFNKVDSLAYNIYGEENISINIVYNRTFDKFDNEVLYIIKVKIMKVDKNVIRIKIKRNIKELSLYDL